MLDLEEIKSKIQEFEKRQEEIDGYNADLVEDLRVLQDDIKRHEENNADVLTNGSQNPVKMQREDRERTSLLLDERSDELPELAHEIDQLEEKLDQEVDEFVKEIIEKIQEEKNRINVEVQEPEISINRLNTEKQQLENDRKSFRELIELAESREYFRADDAIYKDLKRREENVNARIAEIDNELEELDPDRLSDLWDELDGYEKIMAGLKGSSKNKIDNLCNTFDVKTQEQLRQEAELIEPEEPAVVEEPEEPAVVEEPEEPAVVAEPEEPAVVEEPEEPAEAAEKKEKSKAEIERLLQEAMKKLAVCMKSGHNFFVVEEELKEFNLDSITSFDIFERLMKMGVIDVFDVINKEKAKEVLEEYGIDYEEPVEPEEPAEAAEPAEPVKPSILNVDKALLIEAIKLAGERGKGERLEIGALQRILKIGFNRATSIHEILKEKGIIEIDPSWKTVIKITEEEAKKIIDELQNEEVKEDGYISTFGEPNLSRVMPLASSEPKEKTAPEPLKAPATPIAGTTPKIEPEPPKAYATPIAGTTPKTASKTPKTLEGTALSGYRYADDGIDLDAEIKSIEEALDSQSYKITIGKNGKVKESGHLFAHKVDQVIYKNAAALNENYKLLSTESFMNVISASYSSTIENLIQVCKENEVPIDFTIIDSIYNALLDDRTKRDAVIKGYIFNVLGAHYDAKKKAGELDAIKNIQKYNKLPFINNISVIYNLNSLSSVSFKAILSMLSAKKDNFGYMGRATDETEDGEPNWLDRNELTGSQKDRIAELADIANTYEVAEKDGTYHETLIAKIIRFVNSPIKHFLPSKNKILLLNSGNENKTETQNDEQRKEQRREKLAEKGLGHVDVEPISVARKSDASPVKDNSKTTTVLGEDEEPAGH